MCYRSKQNKHHVDNVNIGLPLFFVDFIYMHKESQSEHTL